MSKSHRANVSEISYIVVDGEYQLKRSRVIGVKEMEGCGGHSWFDNVLQVRFPVSSNEFPILNNFLSTLWLCRWQGYPISFN